MIEQNISSTFQVNRTVNQAFRFVQDIEESLNWSRSHDSYYIFKWENLIHHSEIYDIVKIGNDKSESRIDLFKDHYLIIIPDENKLKVFVSQKLPESGYVEITGFLKDFKKFVDANVFFKTLTVDEIIYHD